MHPVWRRDVPLASGLLLVALILAVPRITGRPGVPVNAAPPGEDLTVRGNLAVAGPRPWIDVRAFGAKGDGRTDDRAALQAALDALPDSGGTVLLPPGDYLIGAPGLSSERPSVWLLGLQGVSHGSTPGNAVRLLGTDRDLVLLTIGTPRGEVRGWRIENITFKDASRDGDRLAGGLRIVRMFYSMLVNLDFQDITAGYAINLDPGPDPRGSVQYTGIWQCKTRRVKYALTGGRMQDTQIHGGVFFGTNAPGSVGLDLIGEVRVFGTAVQQFQTHVRIRGNNNKLIGVKVESLFPLGSDVGVDILRGQDNLLLGLNIGGPFRAARIRIHPDAEKTQIIGFQQNVQGPGGIQDRGRRTLIFDALHGLKLAGTAPAQDSALIRAHLSASAPWDPPALPDRGTASVSLALQGVEPGSVCQGSLTSIAEREVLVSAHAAAGDTVRFVIVNATGAPLDLPLGQVRVACWNY